MTDEITSLKVICTGGLNSNENSLDLSDNAPGSATRLINYEPSLYGGYRRINGYVQYDTDYPEVGVGVAEGKVLGVFIYKDPFGVFQIIAARKTVGVDSYKFYRYSSGIGWVAYTTGLTLAYSDAGRVVNRVRHKTFNFGNGNQIIFVDGVNNATLFDGTNWAAINSADTGASFATAGGNQAINAPSVVDVFKNHIFLSGDFYNPALIVHSAPNAAYDFTVANGAGQIPAGIEVVQIKPFRSDLFVFGDNDIKKIVTENTDFVLNNVTSNVGCIARDSVLEIGGDLVFLAPDGLRPVAGTSRIGDVELETISKSIQQKLSMLPQQYDMDELVSLVVRKKSQIRYFFSDGSANVSTSFGLLGGLTLGRDTIRWEFGDIQGIRASCCTSGYINKEEYVLHGDYDGKVYRQEIGNNFAGDLVLSVYSTPYLDGGDTEVRKTNRTLNLHIRAEGLVQINASLAYDWGSTGVSKPVSYTREILGAPITYDGQEINYDGPNIVYGGDAKPVVTIPVEGSFFSFRTTFVSYGDYFPHTIQGFVYEITPRGRK